MSHSERGARSHASWRRNFVSFWNSDRCTDYVAPKTFGAYMPGTRNFQPDKPLLMTHSQARIDLRTELWDNFDWSESAATKNGPDKIWSGSQLGGTTARWVLEATDFNREMRRTKNVERMQRMAVMILRGTENVRRYRPHREDADRSPDLRYHQGFCDDLNEISSARDGSYICELVALEGAYYEIYKERDSERNRAIETVFWVFKRDTQ